MTNDPAGLSHRVGTGTASHAAIRFRPERGVQRRLKISPRRLACAPSRGRVAITRAAFAVKVISPSYPVVFAPLQVCP